MKRSSFARVGVSAAAVITGLFVAVGPTTATARTGAASRPQFRASAPAGYVVVHSETFGAPFELQTRVSLACPAGTKPLSGGLDTPSTGLSVNMNSSYPTGRRSWAVKFNNGSPDLISFRVWAVCAKRPDAQFTVTEKTFTAPPHTQTQGSVDCPTGVVVGGGVHSASKSLYVNIASLDPASTTRWDAWINNASDQQSKFTTIAICRNKAPAGYSLQVGATKANPAGSETYSDVACDGASVPLSGGAYSLGSGLGQNVNSSAPADGGWYSYVNNADTDDNSVQTLAICAGT